MKSSALETLVGAVIVALALGFFIFAYKTSGLGSSAGVGYHISAEFDNIDGVAVGSDVRVAGIKVGTVTGQSLNPKSYQARVEMVINPGIVLSEDTSAKVTSEGLLGSKFVVLEPGGADVKLAEGGVISYTQGAVDIWSLISQAMFSKNKTPDASTAPKTDIPQQ
ncbi:MAG: outer membrane lipid asymmetry maintenance protein MlaD [Alphaproteobacteria bacterium]|nr:outer membrane lipid asymmetry maintenance protein MlaD [Alphaproteobacteria bacterium]